VQANCATGAGVKPALAISSDTREGGYVQKATGPLYQTNWSNL